LLHSPTWQYTAFATPKLLTYMEFLGVVPLLTKHEGHCFSNELPESGHLSKYWPSRHAGAAAPHKLHEP